MSLLFVTYYPKEHDHEVVEITCPVADFLFENVMKPLAPFVADQEFLDKAEARQIMECASITQLTADEFNRAYDLIQAQADHLVLAPFADEILAKMRDDERYVAIV